MRTSYLLGIALIFGAVSGCARTRDCVDKCCVDVRNRCYAERAWMRCKDNFCDVEDRCDFGNGFKDGYIAVANGAGQCQPALPPQEYWRFENQNPEGQARQLAWFNGYSYGALYAEEEGIASWSRVVTSPTLPAYRKRRAARAEMVDADGRGDPIQPYEEDGVPMRSAPPSPDDAAPPSPEARNNRAFPTAGEELADPGVRWADAADGY